MKMETQSLGRNDPGTNDVDIWVIGRCRPPTKISKTAFERLDRRGAAGCVQIIRLIPTSAFIRVMYVSDVLYGGCRCGEKDHHIGE